MVKRTKTDPYSVLSVSDRIVAHYYLLFSVVQITLILPGVPPLGICNQNTVGENGDFQPLYAKIFPK